MAQQVSQQSLLLSENWHCQSYSCILRRGGQESHWPTAYLTSSSACSTGMMGALIISSSRRPALAVAAVAAVAAAAVAVAAAAAQRPHHQQMQVQHEHLAATKNCNPLLGMRMPKSTNGWVLSTSKLHVQLQYKRHGNDQPTNRQPAMLRPCSLAVPSQAGRAQ